MFMQTEYLCHMTRPQESPFTADTVYISYKLSSEIKLLVLWYKQTLHYIALLLNITFWEVYLL